MPVRESRVQQIMDQDGLDRMQAVNVIRQQDARHSQMRRDPRAFDFRFGRELLV